MNVINWQNINFDLVNIHNPLQTKFNYVNYEITYNNELFLLQSPKLIINLPDTNYFQCNSRYKKISLYHNNNIDQNNNFFSKIEQIEKTLLDNFISVYKIDTTVKKIYSVKKLTEKSYLNLNIQLQNNKPILSIFDRFKNRKDVSYLSKDQNAIGILYLKDIWKKNNVIGVSWILLQTMIYLPIIKIDNCLIKNTEFVEEIKIDETSSNNKIEEKLEEESNPLNEQYAKYVKMFKFGVSKGAINIELQKNNLDYKTFLDLIGQKNNKEDFISYNFDSRPVEKKVVKKPKIKKRVVEKPKKQSLPFRPPSSGQLKDMLSNLKKVKKNKKLE